MMLLELDLGINVANNKTNEIGEFTKELNNTLNKDEILVDGTSVYDLYPNIIENYCENEGVYITQNGKYETADELYEALNMNNEDKIMRKITKAIEKILKFAIDKLVKNKQ